MPFSTTTRAAAARAALAASTRQVGARWAAAGPPRVRWRDAWRRAAVAPVRARFATAALPVRARLAAAAVPVRARLAAARATAPVGAKLAAAAYVRGAAPRLRLLAARRPRRLARLRAVAAAHSAAVRERARRAAALAMAFRARRAGYVEKLTEAWRLYGCTAVGTHFAVYGTTLAGLTCAVDVGLLGGGREREEAVHKMSTLIEGVAPRALVETLRSSPTAGAFAVAWVLAKFTEPARLVVTVALTPRVAAARAALRLLAARGVIS